ncbi:MAG: hypothetical protein NT059_08250 [Planctomycetota bacterium]|nr:hypothetical protein [Planctomycetota bacterium]
MRTDVTDERKTALLREFLECPSVPDVRRENLNSVKAPSELGERLKVAIAARPDYVDGVLTASWTCPRSATSGMTSSAPASGPPGSGRAHRRGSLRSPPFM